MLNGVEVISIGGQNGSSSSNSILLPLNADDEVWLQLMEGKLVESSVLGDTGLTSFSGYRIGDITKKDIDWKEREKDILAQRQKEIETLQKEENEMPYSVDAKPIFVQEKTRPQLNRDNVDWKYANENKNDRHKVQWGYHQNSNRYPTVNRVGSYNHDRRRPSWDREKWLLECFRRYNNKYRPSSIGHSKSPSVYQWEKTYVKRNPYQDNTRDRWYYPVSDHPVNGKVVKQKNNNSGFTSLAEASTRQRIRFTSGLAS